MKIPRLVDPSGTPLTSEQEEATSLSGFAMSTSFRMDTGLGMVRLKTPTGEEFLLFPQEARQLGLNLIVNAEVSIDNATAIRMMVGTTGMPTEQAVGILQELSRESRMHHYRAYKEFQQKVEQDRQQQELAQADAPEV